MPSAAAAITSRREDVELHVTTTPAEWQFGGIRVYAPDTDTLRKGWKELSDALDLIASQHLSAGRGVLHGGVKRTLRLEKIPKRVFGALLGYRMRTGHMDCIPCEAWTGTNYRAYLTHSRLEEYLQAKAEARALLVRHGHLSIPEVEQNLFGGRVYNSWSTASQILGNLAWDGVCEFVDKQHTIIPNTLLNALRSHS